MDKFREILLKVKALLDECCDWSRSDDIAKALDGNEDELWEFLCSNELWGGAGSIADEGGISNPEIRVEIQQLLIELGKLQIKADRVNVRTESWIEAFEIWQNEEQ